MNRDTPEYRQFLGMLTIGQQVVTGGKGYPWRLLYVEFENDDGLVMCAESMSGDWGVYSQVHHLGSGSHLDAINDEDRECYLYPATPEFKRRVEVYDLLTKLHRLSDKIRKDVDDTWNANSIEWLQIAVDLLEIKVK